MPAQAATYRSPAAEARRGRTLCRAQSLTEVDQWPGNTTFYLSPLSYSYDKIQGPNLTAPFRLVMLHMALEITTCVGVAMPGAVQKTVPQWPPPPPLSPQICTSADEGQTLRGCFHISHGSLSTQCVPHDATSSALQSLIEGGLNAEPVDGPGPLPFPRAGGAGGGDGDGGGEESSPWAPGTGRVNVTTDGFVDDVGGRCWNVTFSSAVGAVGPLTVSSSSSTSTSTADDNSSSSSSSSRGGNRLTGLGAAVSVETLQAGNTISGSFSIRFTGGVDDAAEQEAEGTTAATHETSQLPATASASAVSEALLELPGVAFARTTRSVPAGAVSAAGCSDGLCRVGPTPGGGLEWIVELGTRVGNAEPSSPTVAVATWAEDGGTAVEGVFGWPEVDGGQLEGEGAAVSLRKGWAGAAEQLAASFNASQPFSIALGGAGASHGKLFSLRLLALIYLTLISSARSVTVLMPHSLVSFVSLSKPFGSRNATENDTGLDAIYVSLHSSLSKNTSRKHLGVRYDDVHRLGFVQTSGVSPRFQRLRLSQPPPSRLFSPFQARPSKRINIDCPESLSQATSVVSSSYQALLSRVHSSGTNSHHVKFFKLHPCAQTQTYPPKRWNRRIRR